MPACKAICNWACAYWFCRRPPQAPTITKSQPEAFSTCQDAGSGRRADREISTPCSTAGSTGAIGWAGAASVSMLAAVGTGWMEEGESEPGVSATEASWLLLAGGAVR